MVSEVCGDAKLEGWRSLLVSYFYFSMMYLFSKGVDQSNYLLFT